MIELVHLPHRRGNVPLRIARGHFATNHSHINYYIDITYHKTRVSEAKASAYQLVSHFINDTPVDTIICLDGTAVLGAFVAEELTKSGFHTINAHQTIYVVEPEYNNNSQMIFRDNIQPMIRGKHVLILMASVTTGHTARKSIEAINYYGGQVAGVAAIYRAPSIPSATCRITPAMIIGTAPTARPVRRSMRWSTATVSRSYKKTFIGPPIPAGQF